MEIFTLSWMTVEAAVAVIAGVTAGSIALLTFGIDSVIEFVAALVVLQAFRAEQASRTTAGLEQRAVRVIGLTFFLLAAARRSPSHGKATAERPLSASSNYNS